MNKANLKSYAPKARLDFIKAVTERANVLGISAAGVVPAEVRGDVALIDGREWPAKVAGQRDELIARIKRHGFEQTMDEVAYTWFNRFAALRYMEIHDYLGHGWRVLSSRDGGLPEILRHASEVTLPGLNSDRAREMQLAGNQDNELYKLLLVAQCNELSRVMPFLFERIDDETELLLPENLLRTDSIVAKLVEQVPEEDWHEIEVIGWLYQFYISEKKDQVISKVVKSDDIPAATQLFTPNWIVQYLVQNSVGRLWLTANPTSTLASQWPYYIQPAEQTREVQAQLDALIQTRIRDDGEMLNPERITVLDPACGSGHILVVAYDVLRAIYLERGYQPRSIPRLILEKNLYGLDIDDRAVQLAAFALLMRARADDRRLFNDPPKLSVLSLKETRGMDVTELATHLAPFGVRRESIKELVEVFASAKTFGSLIRVPTELNGELPTLVAALQQPLQRGDLYARQAAKDLLPIVWQALALGMHFDAVVANPPYMGGKTMMPELKDFGTENYKHSKANLFSMFTERSFDSLKRSGISSMVTLQNWMFLSDFESYRRRLISNRTVLSCAQLGARAFREISGEVVQASAQSLLAQHVVGYRPTFDRAIDGEEDDKSNAIRSASHRFVDVQQDKFESIPGSPIVYWLPQRLLDMVIESEGMGSRLDSKQGLATANNNRFMRLWHEVSVANVGRAVPNSVVAQESRLRWFPCNKGGAFRKWYGNHEYIVNWQNNGAEIKDYVNRRYPYLKGNIDYVIKDRGKFFCPSISWSDVTSGTNAFRYYPEGFVYDATGHSAFWTSDEDYVIALSFLNTKIAALLANALNPSMHFHIGYFDKLPFPVKVSSQELSARMKTCVQIAKSDWDAHETSWNFQCLPMVSFANRSGLMSHAWDKWHELTVERVADLKAIEEANNRAFIDAYGLNETMTPEVPDAEITLTRANRERDSQRLLSFSIGCMMGRYSLVEPGLIHAHDGNVAFDPGRYAESFPADPDGILPLTDERWFEDDAAGRVREFLCAVWGAEALDENMAWLAESLGAKGIETSDETVRRYLSDKFFKDHLQTYKKRPIYWLFSSGKQGAFQALVYLHRYNEGTLARMRAEYVVPLIAKMVSRLDMLDKDVAAASSAAVRTKLQKQIEALRKKQIELLAYDEKLRHYADKRISLDLDDGVKANYAKFGDLVAESKAITGGNDE